MAFPEDDARWGDERHENAETGGFRADTYEKLELAKEERKVQAAKVKKFKALKSCLDAKKELVALEVEKARENRLQAEAERDRLRELRLLRKERRKLKSETRKVEECKEQAANEIRRLVAEVRRAEDEALSEHEKRVYIETGEKLDPETLEFLTCPRCSTRMIIPEEGYGRVCPECCYRKES